MTDPRIDRDLAALGAATARALPSLADTRRALEDADRRARRGDRVAMFFTKRKLSIVLGVAALAALLCLVPIPVTRTVGYQASLEVQGKVAADTLATRFGHALGAKSTTVTPHGDGYTIQARVEHRTKEAVERRVNAFAAELGHRGVKATPAVAAIRERGTATVYAMARDEVVELTIDDEDSAEDIVQSIRDQLEAAGVEADVTVEEDGDVTTVRIEPQGEDVPDFEVNGHIVGGHDIGEAAKRIPEIVKSIERTSDMTDEEYRDLLIARLHEEGIDGAQVIVTGETVSCSLSAGAESP